MRSKVKAMEIYQEKLQEGLKYQENAMQLKQRDEQSNYIRAM
jgi:hypothetical protein